MMLWQNDAVNSNGLGCTQQRTKIVDVLDGVEDKQKWWLLLLFSMSQDLLKGGIGTCFHHSDTALMHGSMTELVKARTWHGFNRNMLLFCCLEDGCESRSFTLPFSQ